jgi:hypothetical protein
VRNSNFLLEAYFRTTPGQSGGIVMEKMMATGYSLSIDKAGRVFFVVRDSDEEAEITSRTGVNDGQWHHVIAEADRTASTLTLYIDGRQECQAAGVGAGRSLANDSDLYIGGTPKGRCLAAEFEFARIALGTLADAKTTIEELYKWQFNGPFLRDWTGRDPAAGKRDAGAIDLSHTRRNGPF